jgi:hypothetical protein
VAVSERVCGKHACIQHRDCLAITERCGCPECRALLSAAREPAPGDIAALASGGPDLTVLRVYSDVDGINGDRVADLGWFTAVGEYRTGKLPLAVLRSRGRGGGVERCPHITHDRPDLGTCPYEDCIDRRIDERSDSALRRAATSLLVG